MAFAPLCLQPANSGNAAIPVARVFDGALLDSEVLVGQSHVMGEAIMPHKSDRGGRWMERLSRAVHSVR